MQTTTIIPQFSVAEPVALGNFQVVIVESLGIQTWSTHRKNEQERVLRDGPLQKWGHSGLADKFIHQKLHRHNRAIMKEPVASHNFSTILS